LDPKLDCFVRSGQTIFGFIATTLGQFHKIILCAQQNTYLFYIQLYPGVSLDSGYLSCVQGPENTKTLVHCKLLTGTEWHFR